MNLTYSKNTVNSCVFASFRRALNFVISWFDNINENHEYRYANTHEFTVFFEYVRFIGKTNYIVYFFCQINADSTGSCKSNYHTITTMTTSTLRNAYIATVSKYQIQEFKC
jgi:hypothetical protein